MTEKEVYKKSAKTRIAPQEQSKLLAKFRMKSINYKAGAIKRKFKMGGDSKPGAMITKMNESKRSNIINHSNIPSKQNIAISGLV